MDRSTNIRKTHYVFEYNAELDKAIKEKENSNDKKILEISNLAVKKIKVNHNGESHKFIIFYSSNNISGKNLFENSYFINRIKRDTEDVKKHLRNHLKNIGAEKDKISKIENSLCLNVTAPRPHTIAELKIHEQYKEALNAHSEFLLAYKKAIKEKLPDEELKDLQDKLYLKKRDVDKFETQAFETQKSVIDEGIKIKLLPALQIFNQTIDGVYYKLYSDRTNPDNGSIELIVLDNELLNEIEPDLNSKAHITVSAKPHAPSSMKDIAIAIKTQLPFENLSYKLNTKPVTTKSRKYNTNPISDGSIAEHIDVKIWNVFYITF